MTLVGIAAGLVPLAVPKRSGAVVGARIGPLLQHITAARVAAWQSAVAWVVAK